MTAISYAKAGAAGIGLAARSANTSLELDIQVAAKQAGKGPPKTLFLELDISEREKVERAAKEVEKTFGCLDILINNAGTLPKNESIADSDPLEWWRTWTVVRDLPAGTVKAWSADILSEHQRHIPNDALVPTADAQGR